MDATIAELMLAFKLSDRREFHYSACGREIASAHNSRFIVDRVADLIAGFKTHVEDCHAANQ